MEKNLSFTWEKKDKRKWTGLKEQQNSTNVKRVVTRRNNLSFIYKFTGTYAREEMQFAKKGKQKRTKIK